MQMLTILCCLIVADSGSVELPPIPAANPAPVSKAAIRVEVRLDKDGKPVVAVEGKTVAMKDLKKTFKELVNKSKKQEMKVLADRQLELNTVYAILKMAEEAGFKNLELRVLPKEN